jgi:hypothetical protein
MCSVSLLAIWQYGCMAVWQHGSTEVWQYWFAFGCSEASQLNYYYKYYYFNGSSSNSSSSSSSSILSLEICPLWTKQ